MEENWQLRRLRAIADYQFGRGVGSELFPDGVRLVVSKSTGDVRRVYVDDKLLATLRPSDGFLSLTVEGAKRLMEAVGRRRHWVKVSQEAAPFVAKGRSLFAKHVEDADPNVRPGEEVVVLDGEGRVIAVGRAVLTGREMKLFRRGVAVKVRSGVLEESK